MPGGLAQGLGDSGVVLRWGCGEGVRQLRPKRLKEQFGFAGRLGWDRGLGWEGRGCFLTQATPFPSQEPAAPQRPSVPGRLRGDTALSADYGVLSTGEGLGQGRQSRELGGVRAQGSS